MRLFGKDSRDAPILIAEIGVNHEGDVEAAERMIRLAADAGADAVKFQSYTVERFIAAGGDPARRARVRRFGLDLNAHKRLQEVAKEAEIAFFSSAITEDWIEPLSAMGVEAIKIASGDVDFRPAIEGAARSGLKLLISTGTASEAEVDRAIGWVRDIVGEGELANRLAILHCVSAYPTPLEGANLRAIPTMADRYAPVTIGYSNHVMGREAPVAAVALGAEIVEVHFTDNKHDRDFHDHALSADPDDLAYLAQMLPLIAKARGDGVKRPQTCEEANIRAIRKGVVAARGLSVGHVLSASDMSYARPGTEFPALEAESLVGRTLTQAIGEGETIPRDAVE